MLLEDLLEESNETNKHLKRAHIRCGSDDLHGRPDTGVFFPSRFVCVHHDVHTRTKIMEGLTSLDTPSVVNNNL